MGAHHLDTDTKFHCSRESATEESFGSIQVRRLKDGDVEIIAEESTKKWNGKRWHGSSVFLKLSKEQAEKMLEALK
ncbi:hypothetical protein KNLIENLN_00081 [Sinorhizobium phage NV1.1.1]|nr:hypothetical protein KNLIENLN_00081 [Sinorhizobium phage NV1.1.1]